MRIAILADPLDNQNAGIHTYTRELITALCQVKHSHELIIIRSKKKNDFPNLKNIIIPYSKYPILFNSFRLFFFIPYILRKQKVDIVFEPAQFGPFNLPKRIKRITMIHDLTPMKYPELHRFHSQLAQKLLLKKILRKTDLILANSENTKQDIIESYPSTESKIYKILLGKDEDFKALENFACLDKYNIVDQQYILSVGTIEPRKDLGTLLDAFEIYKHSKSSNLKLVIVGQKGWKSESFFERLRQHPFAKDIVLTGFVSKVELRSLYTHTLMFIYPSMYEGFGLPILEALSCGAPVITANNSSLPEVGGKATLYFKTSDPEDLSEKINILCNDKKLRQELKIEGPKQAAKFSWSNYAKEFIQVIEERFGNEH